jgi:chlorobactene glucosyltransferase
MESAFSEHVWMWYALCGIVAFEALVWHCVLGYIGRTKPMLRADTYDGPPDPAPRISVVVAARNEEQNIEACVGSLLAQDYPNYEVIAVDDRSEDRTLALLQKLLAGHEKKLQVLTIRELKEGWFGKNNAMREGVARSTGDWLCFTDADCRFTSRSALTAALRDALAHQAQFLTLLPPLEERATWERIVQPACVIMMISWFLPLRVNNPRSKTAYANGQFMLMTRECYNAIGGHARVRAELNEDMVMSRHAKEGGFRFRLAENNGLSTTRMYSSLAEAWSGWSRIFHGSIPSIAQLGLAAFWHVAFAIGPWIGLAIAFAGWALASERSTLPWSSMLCASLVALVAHQTVLWRVYGMMHSRKIWSLAHGLGSIVVVGMLLNAITKTLGLTSTTWRGVTYRSGKLEKDAVSSDDRVIAAEPES